MVNLKHYLSFVIATVLQLLLLIIIIIILIITIIIIVITTNQCENNSSVIIWHISFIGEASETLYIGVKLRIRALCLDVRHLVL